MGDMGVIALSLAAKAASKPTIRQITAFGTSYQYSLSRQVAATGESIRHRYTAYADATDISMIFNGYSHSKTGTFADLNMTDTVLIKAAIEVQGNRYPCMFYGADQIQLSGGQTIQTDPLSIVLNKGDPFFVIVFILATTQNSTYIPTGYEAQESKYGDVIADPALPFNASPRRLMSPAYIVGQTKSRAVLIIGDSIAFGDMDGTFTGSDGTAYNMKGWANRALAANQIPSINISQAGARVTNYANQWVYYKRIGAARYCTDAICCLGANDVTRGIAYVEEIKAEYVAFWHRLTEYGLKVYQTTLLPRTVTSSDAFATVENQTRHGGIEPTRQALNEWIRSCPAPLSGYIEIAHIAESTPNSGRWKPLYTTDGTHPNEMGHVAIANSFAATANL